MCVVMYMKMDIQCHCGAHLMFIWSYIMKCLKCTIYMLQMYIVHTSHESQCTLYCTWNVHQKTTVRNCIIESVWNILGLIMHKKVEKIKQMCVIMYIQCLCGAHFMYIWSYIMKCLKCTIYVLQMYIVHTSHKSKCTLYCTWNVHQKTTVRNCIVESVWNIFGYG